MKLLFFYADPGSGMMLLQILLAFGASGVFYFRKYLYKMLGKGNPLGQVGDTHEIDTETIDDATE